MAFPELLERQSALRQLAAALAGARTGNGRVVLVTGEAGIGKTSLVDRFVERHSDGVRLLWGACEPFLEPKPFGPLYDVALHIDGLPSALSNAHDLASVEQALLDGLRAPAMLVIEDLHWADEASLNVLSRVGPELATLPVLVIFTTRDDSLSIGPIVRAFLDRVTAWPMAERLDLAPLSEEAVRELIGDRTADPAAVHAQTGGNPFFVTEALASTQSTLPTSVRDAVQARLARLPQHARTALDAAAIIGVRSERELLLELIGGDQAGINVAHEAGLLMPSGGTYVFRHELVRQAVLESIPLSRSLSLNDAAWRALESRPELERDWTRLAHHAVTAANADAIWEFARAAGRQAAWARAHHAAVTWFERALEQAAGQPAVERAALLDAYAQELDTVNRRPESVTARERAIELWTLVGDQGALGESLARLSAMLQLVGRMPEAIAANARALAVLEPLGPSEALISAYNTQAWMHLGSGTSEAGVEVAERAIAMAEELRLDDDLPRLTEIAGLCELYRDSERAMVLLDRSLALSLEQKLMTRAGNTYANLGSIYVDFHQFARAETVQAHGLAFARSHELSSVHAFMEGWQAVLEVHLGQWTLADVTIAQALERPAPSPGRGTALLALGRLRTRRGAGDAVTPLRESLDILQGQGFRQREGLIRAALAEAAWHAGDVAEVLAQIDEGLPLALRFRQPWYVGELAYWAWLAGRPIDLPDWTAEPHVLQIAGRGAEAAERWAAMGCPYEQARALAESGPGGLAAALAAFESLGARPALQALRGHAPTVSLETYRARQPLPDLTARQSLIADLVSDGLTNHQIASYLGLSVKTVDHHVAAVFDRLDLPDRRALTRWVRAARKTDGTSRTRPGVP